MVQYSTTAHEIKKLPLSIKTMIDIKENTFSEIIMIAH